MLAVLLYLVTRLATVRQVSLLFHVVGQTSTIVPDPHTVTSVRRSVVSRTILFARVNNTNDSFSTLVLLKRKLLIFQNRGRADNNCSMTHALNCPIARGEVDGKRCPQRSSCSQEEAHTRLSIEYSSTL